jgi:putative NIF3 family GTP cyclohydrolase 1 type 2
LGQLVADVRRKLPETLRPVLAAGEEDRPVRRVAVAGGAGDFLLGDALRSDADVFVTSDLRHHPAVEFVEQGGPALVDVSHWAAEWTWLPHAESRLTGSLDTVETRVSTICTDAWTLRA